MLSQESLQKLRFSFNCIYVARSSFHAVSEVWCACSGAMTFGVHLICSMSAHLIVSAVVWSLHVQFGTVKLTVWLHWAHFMYEHDCFRWVLCSFARNFLSPKMFPFGLFYLLTYVSAKKGSTLRNLFHSGFVFLFRAARVTTVQRLNGFDKKKKHRSAPHFLPPPAIDKRKNVCKSNCVKRWRQRWELIASRAFRNTVPDFSTTFTATFR